MNLPALSLDKIASLPLKVQALFALKGQIVTLLIGREAKMRKGMAQIYKFSHIQVRVGVNYDNMKAVQEKRASGELPAENQGLSWGKYVEGFFPYLIEHKEQLYFRFSTLQNANSVHSVRFVRNKKDITVEEAKQDCLASEFSERDSLDTFTLKVESILEINGKEVL